MNKGFYNFTNFILGLTATVSLIQGIFVLFIGNKFFFLDLYPYWFWTLLSLTLATELLMLKYYHFKKFRLSFSAGLLDTISFLVFSFVFYHTIMTRDLERFYIPAFLSTVGAGLLYGLSLIFSSAGTRPWLRLSGVLMFLCQLILLSTHLWVVSSPEHQAMPVATSIFQWTSIAYSLIPLLLMMNFLAELKSSEAAQVHSRLWVTLASFRGIIGLIAIFFLVVTGTKLYEESYWFLSWQKRSQEKSQQMAQLFEARSFVSSRGDTLQYRILAPLDYDPQQKYPLVVCLHGGIEHGTDNTWQLSTAPAPLLSEDANRRKYPAFLFVPQCPKGYFWGGLPAYPYADSLVFEAIIALEEEFSIDEKRRYVAGVSGGGYGSWHFISMRPDMFAAAIPVCGDGDPQYAPEITNIPVWAFHGEKDRNVPVSGSRNMIAAIKEAGGNPLYTEYPDAGHGIWEMVERTPGLLDWLFAQQKD